MKKLFAWILTLAMVLSLAPMGVFAAEPETIAEIASQPEIKPETPAEDGTYEIPFQVNPLYREAYEQGILPIPEPEESDPEDEPLQNAPHLLYATYVTQEQATEQLRQSMVRRETTVHLYISSGETNYTKMCNTMVEEALNHTGKPKEGDYLLWHYQGWSANVYRKYTGSGYQYHITMEISYLTTTEQEQEMDTAVSQLLNELNVKNKQPYDKVRGVYDYVCQNITYDYANLNDQSYLLKHTAYAALLHKTAVCQGYASLVYRMLLELGVDNRVIAGESAGGPHGWNIVKLGDVYYNLDSTWDAETGDYLFFLRNQANFPDHYRYLEYASTQFHTTYPMSGTDYVPGVAGVAEYEFVMGICGDNAWWTINRDGVLTISGTGATYDYQTTTVLNNAAPWMYWADGFRHVVIEEGITALGYQCFDASHYSVKQIESVKLPDSLVTIGGKAFFNCWSLASVNFGNGVQTIGSQAFRDCEALQEIRLPASVTTIGWEAFSSCRQLQTVILREGLEDIGSSAFHDCGQLRQINLPESVKTISDGAFDYCLSLETIVFPSRLTALSGDLFRGCSNLREIWFTGDVPQTYNFAFRSYAGTIWYPAGNATWTEEVMAKSGPKATWLPYCPNHHYEAVTYTTTCVRDGGTFYTCKTCNHSYVENLQYATGLHIFAHDLDTTCETCGYVRPIRESRPVVHMFRMFDPNSGEHFYTGSELERDNLVAAGWNYEGVGFSFPLTTGDPVHRLYDPVTGEHLYTMDVAEKDDLLSRGWNYEGIAFNSAFADEVPQYRLHNPNATRGAYHFTSSLEERDFLIAAGWEYQGIGWYSCWK